MLLVCAGNVCRSPVAELLLSSWFSSEDESGLAVSSAGTRALDGQLIEPRAAALLPGDIVTSSFRARQLTPQMVRDADVVLCMDREVRSETVIMEPSALSRVFAVREFGRMLALLNDAPDNGGCREKSITQRWQMLVAAAPAVRPQAVLRREDADDVADPYGRSARHYVEMLRQMEPALSAIRDVEHKFK
ncbi:low molecular weight phosphatase family protein [Arthrobacter sp.]|uniref:arsenate reductase/protein-tyrosine-phosphatase family protein n=1 Tax=Arthrobacter sp. TaxID=1667 RepID=UPI003A8DCC36